MTVGLIVEEVFPIDEYAKHMPMNTIAPRIAGWRKRTSSAVLIAVGKCKEIDETRWCTVMAPPDRVDLEALDDTSGNVKSRSKNPPAQEQAARCAYDEPQRDKSAQVDRPWLVERAFFNQSDTPFTKRSWLSKPTSYAAMSYRAEERP